MKNNVRFWLVGLVAAMSLILAACGQQGGTAAPTTAPAAGEATAPAETGGEAPAGEATTSLEIANQGEQLLFDKDALGPVPAGEEITLTFSNSSTVNPHNWVLLSSDSEEVAATVDEEGAAAGEAAGYIPEDSENILAHTELLAAGANGSETLTFTAPEAGSYLYICTVPGHYAAGMKGTLTVQ